MTADIRCSIDRLEIQNVRCFGRLSVNFHERLTVLVAPNGGGKTTILNAAAVALRPFVDTMGESDEPQLLLTEDALTAFKGFDPADVRRVMSPAGTMEAATPVRAEITAHLLGSQFSWLRELRSIVVGVTTTDNAKAFLDFVEGLRRNNTSWTEGRVASRLLFPVVAYYGTGRLWSIDSLAEARGIRELVPNARFRGYTDCLTPSSRYKAFVDWFRRFSYEATNPISPHRPLQVLDAVRLAVDTVLSPTGWYGMEWDFAEDTIAAYHRKEGRLPVDFLSDGIRTMIGLVADVAHRAARLNPGLKDVVAHTPGIVLIDEVDLHLHPEWQQNVLTGLQRAFPEMQFVVTTHSPQVLSTVPAECIRRLVRDDEGNWIVEQPQEQTRGIESSHVMATVMGTDPIPPVDESRWLAEYRALIQENRYDSPGGCDLRSRLEAHFGPHHPVIAELDGMIRLQQFKRTLPPIAQAEKSRASS